MSVYDDLPDKSIIIAVNKLFYEKIFSNSKLFPFFKGVPEEHISTQQSDFITGAIGGPNNYCGKTPATAHPHLFITEEDFNLRQKLLKEALIEANAPKILYDAWLKIDDAFRESTIKKDINECKGRYPGEEILMRGT